MPTSVKVMLPLRVSVPFSAPGAGGGGGSSGGGGGGMNCSGGGGRIGRLLLSRLLPSPVLSWVVVPTVQVWPIWIAQGLPAFPIRKPAVACASASACASVRLLAALV